MSSRNLAAITLLASLACHLFLKRYEPTDPPLLIASLVVPPLILAFFQEDLGGVFRSFLSSCSLYYAGLLTSIISKLWLTFVESRGQLHLYVKELHDNYGPVVRIGPNELSITEVSLLPSILGANGMPKGPLWDGRQIARAKGAASKEAAGGTLIASRDSKHHAEARKAWNKAFIPAAVKGYEPMLIRRVAQLVDALGSQKDTNVDLSQWFSFFSFDLMGDIAFGGGFELMRGGDKDGLWHIMERGLHLPALTQQIPWCIYFSRISQLLAKREMLWGSSPSIKLRDGFKRTEYKRAAAEPYPFPLMVSNSLLAIVAGSDTSSTVMANTFFFLLSHPESYKRLQSELDESFPRGDKEPTDAAVLASLPYLNAVIKESMRLLPPVATSLQRAPTVGTGSKVLGESFVIPEGTSIVVPPYTIHRDPRYFSPSPEKYIPERWLAEDETNKFMVNETHSYPSPWASELCREELAMLEIRMVVAYMMQAFEMQFGDGYDKQRWEADLKDYLVMQKSSLPVIFTRRTA
ncbi:cytochrome P450 [Mycena haematopus]|nr:cytochrome P450 [Mycena haematopus]